MTELEKEAIEKLLHMTFWVYLLDTKHRDVTPKDTIRELENTLQEQVSVFPQDTVQVLLHHLQTVLPLHFPNLGMIDSSEPPDGKGLQKHILELFAALTDNSRQTELANDIIRCFYNPINRKTDPAAPEDRPIWQGSHWLAENSTWTLSAFLEQENEKNSPAQQLVSLLDVLYQLREILAAMRSQKHTLTKDSLFWQHSSYVARNDSLSQDIDAAVSTYFTSIRKVLSKFNQVGYLQQNLELVTKLHSVMETQRSCFSERRQALDAIRIPLESLITADPFSLENTLQFCAVIRERTIQSMTKWQKQFVCIAPEVWLKEPLALKTRLDRELKPLQEHLRNLHKRLGQCETSHLEQRQAFELYTNQFLVGDKGEPTHFDASELFTIRDFRNLNAQGTHRWRAATNYLLCLSDIECILEAIQDSTHTLATASLSIQTWTEKCASIRTLSEQLSKQIIDPTPLPPKEHSTLEKTLAKLNGRSLTQDQPAQPPALLTRLLHFIDAFAGYEAMENSVNNAKVSINTIKNTWFERTAKPEPEDISAFFEIPQCSVLESFSSGVDYIRQQENALLQLQSQITETEKRVQRLANHYGILAAQLTDTVQHWQDCIDALYTAGENGPLTRKDNTTKAILKVHAQYDREQADVVKQFVDSEKVAIRAITCPDTPPTKSLHTLKQACQEKVKALSERFNMLRGHLYSGLALRVQEIQQNAPLKALEIHSLSIENVFSIPLQKTFERFHGCQSALETELRNFREQDPKPSKLSSQIQLIESHIFSAQSASAELSLNWKKYQIMEKRLAFGPYQQLLAIQSIVDSEIKRLKEKSNASDPRLSKLEVLRTKFGSAAFAADFIQRIDDDAISEAKQRETLERFTQKLADSIVESFHSRELKELSASVQNKILQILRAILAYFPSRFAPEDRQLGKAAPFATVSELTLFNSARTVLSNLRDESDNARTIAVVA